MFGWPRPARLPRGRRDTRRLNRSVSDFQADVSDAIRSRKSPLDRATLDELLASLREDLLPYVDEASDSTRSGGGGQK
jgi:hypothetical protein